MQEDLAVENQACGQGMNTEELLSEHPLCRKTCRWHKGELIKNSALKLGAA